MREIKFRGLTKEGKWVEGNLIEIYERKYILTKDNKCFIQPKVLPEPSVFEITIDIIEVIPETVGQLTGLKDKNGRDPELLGEENAT